jgi:hypothetical protein
MPMPAPLVFVPPRLSLSIARPHFTAFLAAFGVALPREAGGGSPLGFARALWGISAPEAFADAVDLLDLFASDEGSAAIRDAARAAGRTLPRKLSPADLAAVLLTRAALGRERKEYDGVLERALHAFARIVPRSFAFELVAKEPRAAGDPVHLERAIADLHRDDVVAVWHAVDADGSIHLAIVRPGRARAAFGGPGGSVARRARRDRTVDVLGIDVAEGRIVVSTDEPSLERAYATAAGTALFEDPTFFGDSPSYSFKALVALGSEALAAHRFPGVVRFRIVDITWDDGEGVTHTAHGSDALAAFEKLGGAGGGYVTAVMFRLDAPDVARPIDVAIRLPDRAHYRTPRHGRLARAALGSLGVFAPGSIADDSFTLAPWVHAEWRWRKVMGDALFERMCAAGTLVPAKTRMVSGPEMGKYGWSYVSFDLRSEPGKKYAVAMDPALRSRDLEADELRMWRLDPAAVARALARDLGSDAAEPDSALAERALDLGVVSGEEITLRVFVLLRSPGPAARALADAMVRAAGASHVVVLLPEGRRCGGGVEIGLTLAELFGEKPIAAKVFAAVEKKKGLKQSIVAPWRRVAPDVRFVAEEKTGRLWLDREELVVPDSGRKLLLGAARGGGSPVPPATLARLISPNRGDDGVVRQTARRLARWIPETFAAKGKRPPPDADAILEYVPKKGWRMTVKCEVR